ncbi:TPA: hypothetical protein ACNVX4_006302 [Pseudomonas aeruginosa]|uniref:hypothetical protein n=1 Tax=Pseudomonas aeruginosa TaxID=287 RepID=UPI00287ED04D|nr:hypothetical protein [Pseudomonas aeruginosa]EKF7416792.1 hypothetical protein [Pseudomonas aeruginosa]MDS9917748.1 hypothetical protein [Pseudomonas aeruginosa]HCA5866809.1 hypothetical protein [Pseudomonas aeruginosa]HCA7379996.1 hypothetical protein [Pseudomonas aeruginosa]HCA7775045.1 hypothetical protein [Pseudomonas aeruginosa]
MEMNFRTTAGAIISANPQTEQLKGATLADPAAEQGIGQVEPAFLLRKQIEHAIRECNSDPAAAALAVCVILDSRLDLAEEGYFDDDETVLNAIVNAG